MQIHGTRLHGSGRAERLHQARVWRETMRPYFDAIYGPTPVRCRACGGTGVETRGNA